MRGRTAHTKGAGTTASRFRNWKVIAIIAGATAVTVVAAVLIVAAVSAPDDNGVPDSGVVATVNGKEISAATVGQLQVSYHYTHGRGLTFEQALELLIREELLYQEATRLGYQLTSEEAEKELLTDLALKSITRRDFEAQLEMQGASYDAYLEDLQKQLAIANYIDDTLHIPEVTEEQAMEFYREYKERYPDETRTFEELEYFMIAILEEQEEVASVLLLVEELKEKADIRYTNSG